MFIILLHTRIKGRLMAFRITFLASGHLLQGSFI